jgi:hypothetical protein
MREGQTAPNPRLKTSESVKAIHPPKCFQLAAIYGPLLAKTSASADKSCQLLLTECEMMAIILTSCTDKKDH